METTGVHKVLLNEWFEALALIDFALDSDCEGESEGSMLTRAALVTLYAILDAQLSVIAQWRMRETPRAFADAEILFLNEVAVGVGHEGEIWLGEDYQSFKKRIKAVPAILSRRVDGTSASVDLSRQWGRDLLNENALRNSVMHSELDVALPRITKRELLVSSKSVFAYFEELSNLLPASFEYAKVLLEHATELIEKFAHV